MVNVYKKILEKAGLSEPLMPKVTRMRGYIASTIQKFAILSNLFTVFFIARVL
jgi:hypothetical protein